MNPTPNAPTNAPSKPAEPKAGEDKNPYRATLNLPKTAFPMKANLVQNEPASLKRWHAMNLYTRLRDRARDNAEPRYTFHDGPPYANGNIHLGHLMNKVLKDLVVRTHTMMGYDVPYIPGWDCHGLPIEHKVMTDLVESGKIEKLKTLADSVRRVAIRAECKKYAEKFIKLQAGQMQRLETLADYENPYMTMAPAYEGAVLEALAALVERGLVYRALKAVHWSIENETALAEAELEYYDRQDTSVYVDFEAADRDAVYDAFGLTEPTPAEPDAGASGHSGSHPSDETSSNHDAPASGSVRPGVTPSFMIWTTTPWTLPANLAIAVNPKFNYALVRVDGNVTVMAEDAVERVTKAAKADSVEVLATTTGDRLVGLRYRHPFRAEAPRPEREPDADVSKVYTVVAADYVTLEDGTGLVHTAPGHGSEDYQTGKKVGLPIYCPVRENGSYDSTVPDWLRGTNIWKANSEVVEHLRASGHLFYDHTFMHSYPHDWRGKSPVIFRATEQWFIGVDMRTGHGGMTLRQMAMTSAGPMGQFGPETRGQRRLAAEFAAEQAELEEQVGPLERDPIATQETLDQLKSMDLSNLNTRMKLSGTIQFVPPWGRDRLRGMLESRPDWCISRQRSWGLPIPAFYFGEGNDTQVLMTAASVRAVAKAIREKGSDLWFTGTPEELLKHYNPESDPDLDPSLAVSLSRSPASLRKGADILDVWFESGCSWNAVMRERFGPDAVPTDLYLEGSDQHRGWFQASLLPCLGVTGMPPFKTLLTHGFMVDKDGKKMSKSLGNTLEVEDLLKDYGADVCRWWVSGLDYENDVKVDKSFFDVAGESYRKVRNTLRFMLSNLYDFGGTGLQPVSGGAGATGLQPVPSSPLPPTSLDAWILSRLDALSTTVIDAYKAFDYRAAHLALFDFCNDTLSSVYLAAVKDRLYCDKPDAPRRRQTQATLFTLTDTLCRLLAPIMCHTADEAFRTLHRVDDKSERSADVCVHLAKFAPATAAAADDRWAKFFTVRDRAQGALERAKAPATGAPGVENPLDAGIALPNADGSLTGFDPVDLADLLGVSQVRLDPSIKEPRIIDLRDPAHNAARCDRSWKRDGTVRKRSDGGMLSDRDAAAVGVA